MKIESLTNAHVKEWVKLKEKKYRDETNLFIVEGDHLVEEAQKLGTIKEIISTDENVSADYYVTKEVMKKISNQKSPSPILAICNKLKEQPLKGKVLVLDGIQDPGNLGTVIRSAVAFHFETIILSLDSVDLYNEKVIRASEGMLFHVNCIRTSLPEFLQSIKGEYQIITTNVKKGINIKKVAKQEKIAIIIGNEGQGVKESTEKFADTFVKLAMNPACESLNAGVAASILMYEINEATYE